AVRGVRTNRAEDRADAHRGGTCRRGRFAHGDAGSRRQDARARRLPLPRRGRRRARAGLPVDRAAPARHSPRPACGGYRGPPARRIDGLMSKKRVHEIAKEHGLSSKELLERLRAAGVDAKAAASSVEESAALKVLGVDGASAPVSSNGGPAQAAAPSGSDSGGASEAPA